MCGMQRNWSCLLLWLLCLTRCGTQIVEDPLDAMDLSKSPCENFHEHACGNWYSPYGLRALGAHDMRTQVRALNKQLLVRHFEASSGQREQQQQQQQQQQQHQLFSFYDSCMSERQSLRIYMDAVERLWPDWWLLNNATSCDWARGGAALRQFGAQGLWRLLVQPNWQAAEQRIFYLLAPDFELLGQDDLAEYLYERYLKNLLLELGLRVRRAAKLAAQLLDFERQLRQLQQEESGQKMVLHAPQTLQQLDALLPQLRLCDYFQTLLGERYTPQLMLVADTEYLQRLQRLLIAATVEPHILSSWLLLQLPAHFELHLHEDISLAKQREHCLQQLNSLLPRELSLLQLRLLHGSDAAAADFLTRTEQQLQQLFATLKLQFERLLNATLIFEHDPTTKLLALQKLRAMRLLLPQPLKDEVQQQQHQQQELHSSRYDANLLRLSQAKALQQFQAALDCLQLPCNLSAWTDDHDLGPLDVNVYYRLKLNAIELPLGLLREPLMLATGNATGQDARARARLFGGLGYMLGHELLHGFDYDGINYDYLGHATSQWPARTIIRFGLRAGCYLVARYSNASLTINENIADSEGLRLAFEAYRQEQLEQDQGKEQGPVPPDNASLRSFFVAFAQNWCGQAAAPSSGVQQQQQQHATHWERVNNVLGNFPEFAEVFACKAGSLMHPPDKCRIW